MPGDSGEGVILERAPFVTVPANQYKCNTPNELLQAALSKGHRVSEWGIELAKHHEGVGGGSDGDVDFVDASNAELGYADGCTVDQTIEAAARFNLEPCFHEDGLLVRGSFVDQPMGDCRLVALKEAITVFGGGLRVWCLRHKADGFWLSGREGRPDNVYGGDVRWVFRRKPPTLVA